MATAQNIIEEALRLIHVLRPNATFTGGGQEYPISLDALNQVIDGFSVDGATIYQEVREQFPLNGSPSYTMGTGGTFNTTRPIKLRAAGVTATDGSKPAEICQSERFERILDRSVTGAFIDLLTCDYASPIATIYVWPAPATGTLELWSYKPLTQFAALTDTVTFPPGYLATLKYNLAVALVSEFPGAVLDQWVMQKAIETRAALAALNMQTIGAPTPPLGTPIAQTPLRELGVEQPLPAIG